jgi:pimeloyl-ACP methyl ester carboxylesterase
VRTTAIAAVFFLAAAPAVAQSRANRITALLGEGLADQGFWKIAVGPQKLAAPKDGGALSDRERFLARLTSVDLEALKCDELFPRGTRQLTVTVHGIGGAGEEWEPALAPLAAGNTPLYMYRWLPTGSREGIAHALADGLNRIQECLRGNSARLLVIGHSAGGVLAATAASMLKPDSPDIADRIAIVTVAAPLGGMALKETTGRGWKSFIEELGTDLHSYAAAAPGVRVLHVRTHPRADQYAFNSSPVGHDEGWSPPGVPGARAIDLDETVEHSASVAWAAKALQKDTWKLWAPVGPPPPAQVGPSEPPPAPRPAEEPVRPIPTAPPGQPVRM